MPPVAPKLNPWSACPITFDRREHPTSIRHGGLAPLVLDPIINGFHLMRVLMDGGNSLNLLYQDTVRKMGIDPSRISQSNTTFKGVIPGVEARSTRTITLDVVFGSPDNFRSEDLIFDVVPFRSGYHALLGRTAFASFNAVPHLLKAQNARTPWCYYSQWKCGALPPYRGAHRDPRSQVQSRPIKPHTSSAIKPLNNVKRVWSTLHDDSSATLELD